MLVDIMIWYMDITNNIIYNKNNNLKKKDIEVPRNKIINIHMLVKTIKKKVVRYKEMPGARIDPVTFDSWSCKKKMPCARIDPVTL